MSEYITQLFVRFNVIKAIENIFWKYSFRFGFIEFYKTISFHCILSNSKIAYYVLSSICNFKTLWDPIIVKLFLGILSKCL